MIESNEEVVKLIGLSAPHIDRQPLSRHERRANRRGQKAIIVETSQISETDILAKLAAKQQALDKLEGRIDALGQSTEECVRESGEPEAEDKGQEGEIAER